MNANHDSPTDSPVQVHEPIAFDLTEGQPLPAEVGQSEPAVTLLPPVPFDWNEAVEIPFLKLTLHPLPSADPALLTQDVLRLLDALNRYERALGGKGVAWATVGSQEQGSRVIRLVLTPNELQGAQERLAKLADLANGATLPAPQGLFPLPANLRSLARWQALVSGQPV